MHIDTYTHQPLLLVTSPVYYNYLLLHIYMYTDYLIQFFSLIIDYLFIQSIGAGLCLFMFKNWALDANINENDEDMYKRGGMAWYKRSSDGNENIYLYRIDWFIETLISNNSKLFFFCCFFYFFSTFFKGAKSFRDVINCRKYFCLRKK